MKKFLMTLMVAVFTLTANAQFYVGGETGLWRNCDKNTTDFTLRPEIGYELNEKWDLGLGFGFTHNYNGSTDLDDLDLEDGYGYTKVNSLEINPYARWTFAKLGPVNVFLEMGFGIDTYKIKYGVGDHESKSDAQVAWNIGVKPGLSVSVAKNLQLITHVGFLGYRDSDDSYNGHRNDGFGFALSGENLTLGLLYKF